MGNFVDYKQWYDAVETEMILIDRAITPADDPRKTLHELLTWHTDVALDPRVSGSAQSLIDMGRYESQRD